jgi:hypothetical protein
MPLARLATVVLAVLALAGSAQAAQRSAAAAATLRAPANFHAFLLRADEEPSTSFPRTPAFAWSPTAGAKRYELVLSTSPLFRGSGLIWDDATVTTPVGAVPIALPWITGNPHSLYARVRAIDAKGHVGPWTAPFGFDVRWQTVPGQLSAPAGLVRWTPVEGATSYQVWFLNLNIDGQGLNHWFDTTTNVADEREYYTFHQTAPFMGAVQWRVRAVRQVYGKTVNGLPAVSYGPWSPAFTSTNPAFAGGAFGNLTTTSTTDASPHQLMPGFSWNGDSGRYGRTELYRVAVFTDKDCLNQVFESPAVGSPAYAPRLTATGLKLPTDTDVLTVARGQNLAPGPDTGHRADGTAVAPNELGTPATFTPTTIGAPSSGSSSSGTQIPPITPMGGAVDLWDVNWPEGEYYWTVLPVRWSILTPAVSSPNPATPPTTPPTGPPPPKPIGYWDDEIPQDACATGRSATFGKESQQPDTGGAVPYSSGLSPKGRLAPASTRKPTFFGAPLVAWKPSLGAQLYEVQWSKTSYPWRPVGNLYTYSTETTLPLQPGTWYYRIRGIDLFIPSGAAQMAWSDNTPVVVAKPKFRVVPGGK